MTATGIFGALIVLGIYFLPTIMALIQKKKQTAAIGALNLLAGWTVIGWFVAFIWSIMKD